MKKISKRQKRAIKQEIKDQYLLGPDGVRANERELLAIPESTVLKYTLRRKQYWLRTLQASRAYKNERDANMYVGMREVLRRWAFVPD